LVTHTFNPRLDILPAPQRRLWPELQEVPRNFVLYGGTAIALRLGHRQSIDFDFFSFGELDPLALLDSLPFLRGAETVQQERNTLTVLVDRGDPVKLSFFGVPKLQVLRPADRTADGVLAVASLLDLAGTKAAVVQVRAEAKDYRDLDAILASGIDLPQALGAAAAIYGASFNPQITLKALSYFEDGDLAQLPHEIMERIALAARIVDLDRVPTFVAGQAS
jgi:Nucleotidyl transferase AbiEii toxin, Type IV TA system